MPNPQANPQDEAADESSWGIWKGTSDVCDDCAADDSWGTWTPGVRKAQPANPLPDRTPKHDLPIVRWTKLGRLLAAMRLAPDDEAAEALSKTALATLPDPSDMEDLEADKEYEDLYEKDTLDHVLNCERPATIVNQ